MCKMVCADLAPKSYSSCNISFKFHWAGSHSSQGPLSISWEVSPHSLPCGGRLSLLSKQCSCLLFTFMLPSPFDSSAKQLLWGAHRIVMVISYSTLFSAQRAKFLFFSFFSPTWLKGLEGLKYILHLIFTLGSSVDNLPDSSSRKNFRT